MMKVVMILLFFLFIVLASSRYLFIKRAFVWMMPFVFRLCTLCAPMTTLLKMLVIGDALTERSWKNEDGFTNDDMQADRLPGNDLSNTINTLLIFSPVDFALLLEVSSLERPCSLIGKMKLTARRFLLTSCFFLRLLPIVHCFSTKGALAFITGFVSFTLYACFEHFVSFVYR